MSVIIDRRLNDRNKSAVNRERFIRRYKAQIQRAVSDMVAERSIRDMERGGEVKIPVRDISEPGFRNAPGGDREYVHPGNREFQQGDRIPRPDGGAGGGGSGSGEGDGDGEDGFAFTLSRDEFMQIFFDDLELPRLARTTLGEIRRQKMQRAGYTQTGSPTNLSVQRSLRNALGRRIALTGAARRRLAELDAQHAAQAPAPAPAPDDACTSDDADDARVPHPVDEADTAQAVDDGGAARALEARALERAALKRRIGAVPFLEEIDLRFRHRVAVPQPISQAVMFCLMDVSASMDERKKDLAKRFFTLLYLFLTRKYEHVEVVFVRHTDDAEEVDEERFFHDRKTGGTVVLSALTLMHEIVTARYPGSAWNIYGAQASDGDAFGADPEKSRGFLEQHLLPLTRHFAYIEVPDPGARMSTLSAAYRRIECAHFAMREVVEHRDIYPVFRDLFSRQPAGAQP
ncbi:MAG TPA: YeaH/YhbH family protein [Quisquiliibacterium sp.]|nr:YeaH/YhbH family protein [Quisquiliibacterium sp.]